MKRIAIITARGGSKRIPKKNIKPFCGKPILAYSIEAALASGLFDTVMVSTDSAEIAAVAKQYGAAVPFYRSEKTANDYATTRDVLEEVLAAYAARGEKYDEMCCLYPTAPFVTAEKLQNACRMLAESGADNVMPVVQFSYPPQRAFVVREGKLQYQYPAYINSRSQDLEPIYHDCGQFYFYRLTPAGDFTTTSFEPLIVPETEVQDIDNENDWQIAELKYQAFLANHTKG